MSVSIEVIEPEDTVVHQRYLPVRGTTTIAVELKRLVETLKNTPIREKFAVYSRISGLRSGMLSQEGRAGVPDESEIRNTESAGIVHNAMAHPGMEIQVGTCSAKKED